MQRDVRSMMDQGLLQINSVERNESVAVIEPYFNLPAPVEITY